MCVWGLYNIWAPLLKSPLGPHFGNHCIRGTCKSTFPARDTRGRQHTLQSSRKHLEKTIKVKTLLSAALNPYFKSNLRASRYVFLLVCAQMPFLLADCFTCQLKSRGNMFIIKNWTYFLMTFAVQVYKLALLTQLNTDWTRCKQGPKKAQTRIMHRVLVSP